jgi:ferritin
MSAMIMNILGLLQLQYAHEMENHRRYLLHSSWARNHGLENIADFFEKEAEGEKGHADKVREFIEARNETLDSPALRYDDTVFAFMDELFVTALDIELITTIMLVNIYSESIRLGDIQAAIWIQDLIAEQTEEENKYQTIIDRIISRGGGAAQVEAIKVFRSDISAAHDIDMFIGASK